MTLNLTEVFHWYILVFLGGVVLLWVWSSYFRLRQLKKDRYKIVCPCCKKVMYIEMKRFRFRCRYCGFRFETNLGIKGI